MQGMQDYSAKHYWSARGVNALVRKTSHSNVPNCICAFRIGTLLMDGPIIRACSMSGRKTEHGLRSRRVGLDSVLILHAQLRILPRVLGPSVGIRVITTSGVNTPTISK